MLNPLRKKMILWMKLARMPWEFLVGVANYIKQDLSALLKDP